jgi:protein tyrosine phosphatase
MYYFGKTRCYLQYYINNTFSANQIVPRIFIGDIASASNKDALQEQGITHILSVYNGCYEIFPDDFKYKIIHINDDIWTDINKYFDESNHFIDMALSGIDTQVMIHCQRGVSRSVTLLIAYLLWKQNKNSKISNDEIDNNINSIIKEIQVHRPIAEPNTGFIKCLKKYIYELNN